MFSQPIIGLVVPFAGRFQPVNWMFCRGQELPISMYESLYSIIGTTYGGDGINTFALPNLCGRVAIHSGQGAQMKNYQTGETGGHEDVWITIDNLPAHNHQPVAKITAKPPCANRAGTTSIPTGNYPAMLNGGAAQYSTGASDTISMGATAITALTAQAPVVKDEIKEPVHIMSPFLAMNFIICVTGIYPSV